MLKCEIIEEVKFNTLTVGSDGVLRSNGRKVRGLTTGAIPMRTVEHLYQEGEILVTIRWICENTIENANSVSMGPRTRMHGRGPILNCSDERIN